MLCYSRIAPYWESREFSLFSPAKKAFETWPQSFAKGQEELIEEVYDQLFVPYVDVFHKGKDSTRIDEEILSQPIRPDRLEDRL